MKPDLRADYKIRLYTGPKTPFFEVSKLAPHKPFLKARIEAEPDMTMPELAFMPLP